MDKRTTYCNLSNAFSFLMLMAFPFLSIAQNNNTALWTPIDESAIPEVGERYIIPSKYETLKLDVAQMREALSKAPMTRTPEVRTKPAFLEIPWPDGSMKTFQIIESPIMEDGLMKKFPEIKTYAGSEVGDKSKYIRLDLTPQGFHAIVLTAGEGTVYVDPYSFGGGDDEHYISYYKSDFVPIAGKTMVCGVKGNAVDAGDFRPTPQATSRYSTCEQRTYRLALSATGEYTTFHGGTVALAQAAQVTTMNRVSAVYMRDFAVLFVIIGNNDLIVYDNAATDPFSNGNTGAMINENVTNTNAVIGSTNYDIGHVFGTNSGGLAGLGVVCSANKARGVTGSAAPVGDPFDIDYVAHEMGHQFGGNHTQNNNCNRVASASMEPGSASTIMGYAGICAPNVQANSDDHFHGVNMSEIAALLTGTTCAVKTPLTNNAPTITGTNGSGITVPGSTPFSLTAIATDPDVTDVLSYGWEQMDPAWTTMPPVATATDGPNFRSNSPTTNPTRYFPNLADLAAGVSPQWEVLSSVSRSMNFRVSVRDNSPGGGCTDETDITINVDGNSGPFVVTVPSLTGIVWTGNTNETVTWNVAGSDVAPVSCANVDILLSTDGGVTYPTVLASNVPNDGSEIITVPNTPSTTCRIMVVCSSGTFFDISDNDFEITASTFDYTVTPTASLVEVCSPNDAVYVLNVGSIGGYNDPVTFSLTGVPAGGIANFSTNPVTPAGVSNLTISGTGSITPGTYTLTLTANSTSGTKVQSLTLTVTDPTSAVTLLSPLNGATAVAIPTTLTWNTAPGAGVTYDIDIATDAGFSTIVDNATGLTAASYIASSLLSNTTYYWRVRATNACGTTPFSSAFSFTTNNCITYMSTNVPVTISATGTPTITSTLNVPISGAISDINVVGLTGTHSWINDLTVTLTNPLTTQISLWDRICNDQDNFDLNFDDAAAPGALPCPPTGAGTYQPAGALSTYNGTDPNGNWTLSITDNVDQDGGSLLTWGLEVCAATDYTLVVTQPNDTVCASGNAVYNIDIGQAGTYTDPVTLSVTGLPAPATASFSTNPVVPVGTSTLTVSNLGTVAVGTYNLTLNTTSTSGPKNQALTLVVQGAPTATTLLTPANLATGVATSVNFTWNAVVGSGITYEIDIATDPTFTAIVDNATGLTGTSYVSGSLLAGTTYYWRIRATNSCGVGNYSTVFSFSTSNCTTIMSTNVPVSIPAVGTGTSTLNFPTTGTIADVNVIDVTGTHTRIKQLTVSVSSPSATSAILWDQICNNQNDFDVSFDDAAAPGALPCPPVGGGTYQSQDLLSVFNGENPSGTWTLSILDNTNGTAATLQAWGLEVCMQPCNLAGSIASTPVACAGENTGSATVTASLGTPGYSYQWDATAGSQTTPTATGLGVGSYNVTISDAGSCELVLIASVSEPTVLTASSTGTTNVSCFAGSDGTATVSGSGGTTAYTYDIGSGPQASGSFTALSANSYTVTVSDANSCTTTVPVSITEPTSALSSLVTASTNPLCNGASDGTVTATATGGTASYSYDIGTGGQGTGAFAGLGAGAYVITVTDGNGCTTTTPSSLTDPVAVGATASLGTGVSCAGGSDGTATAAGSGGTGSYTYLWSNGQNNATATSLSGTSYTVTVTDGNSCSATDNISLTDPTGMTSSASVTTNYNGSDVSCNGSTDGSAMVTATGGAGSYTYLWDNGQVNATATALGATTYTVTITDGSGCTTASSVALTNPTVLTGSSSGTTNVNCFGDSDGATTISGAGGTGSYTYDIGLGAQGSGVFTSLLANNYTVTVSDVNSCTATVPVSITGPASALSASISATTDPLCNSGLDGTVTAVATGGTTSYSYNIGLGVQGTGAFTGLGAGTYVITVTDGNGCTTTTTSILTDPVAVVATASLGTAVSCAGGSDGTATVVGSGGTGSYFYLWSNGQNNATATGLSGISYTVTISDGNSCLATDNISLTDPSGMTSSASVTTNYNGADVSCNGSTDGSVMATVTGGTGTYAYLWDNGQTDATATGLGAATYIVTITDGSGCTTVSSVALTEPTVLTASSSATTNVNCFGGSDGTTTISGSGGTTAYTYDMGTGAQASGVFNSLSANSYTVTVSDANSCTTTVPVSITEPTSALSSLVTASTNPLCNGASDGTVTATATGGTISYSYDIGTGGQGTGIFAGLAAGGHVITVTDGNGCTATAATTLGDPAVVVAGANLGTGVSCAGGSDGTAIASGSGGTGTYTYLWDNGQTNATATGLSATSYTVTVSDGNGCSATDNISLTNPSGMTSSASVTTNYNGSDVSCNGSTDGAAMATATGGAGSYTYLWDNGQTNVTATGLGATTYTVTITDGSGCTTASTVALTEPTALTGSATSTNNVSCFGNSDGSTTISGAGGTTAYTYDIGTGVQSSGSFSPLAANNYTVTITDANSCTATVPVTIGAPTNPLSASISASTNTLCNGSSDGTITATATGGTTAYTYDVGTGSQSSGVITGLGIGSYVVTVTDAGGCTATATSVTITEPSAMTVTASVSSNYNGIDISCNGASDGEATAVATGGVAGYTFMWSGGQTDAIATGLAAGLQFVTITDANGCTRVTSVSLSALPPLVASAVDNGNGTATATGSGGLPIYTYQWDAAAGNQTTATATGLSSSTTYYVTITDDNGCTDSASVSLAFLGLGDLPNLSQFDVLPNPNSGSFQIQISFSKVENANVRITNVLGQVLREYNYTEQAFSIPVDIQQQASGVYFVVLKTEDEFITKKVTITK